MKTTHGFNPVWKLLFLFVFLFSACVTSLEPWTTRDTYHPDPQLDGCWTSDGDSWIFSHEDGKHWLTFTEDGETGRFQLRTFHVDSLTWEDGWRYFDLEPIHPNNGNSLEQIHLLPTHGVMRYRFTKEGLTLSTFDGDALENRLDALSKPTHRTVNDRLLFEASSEEMWLFLEMIQHEDSLFNDSDSLLICQ